MHEAQTVANTAYTRFLVIACARNFSAGTYAYDIFDDPNSMALGIKRWI